MATYEYRCKTDGAFELTRALGTQPASAACPACGDTAERVFSSPMLSVAPRAVMAAVEHAEKTRHEPGGERLTRWRRSAAGRAGSYVLAMAALAAAYYAAAKTGLALAYLDGTVTALWPPVGVGIAALVLFGPRLWPGIVIGDLLVANFSTPLGTVLGQTTGNTLEVVAVALLMRRLFRRSHRAPSSARRRCGWATSSSRASRQTSGGRGGSRTSPARSWSRR